MDWSKHIGARVRITDGVYKGYTATVTHCYSSTLVKVEDLDNPPPKGFIQDPALLTREIELIDATVVSPAAPDAPRPPKKTEPDMLDFFKGPSNYAKCPNCSTGKLVPMFSGAPVCDQACEKQNPRAVGCGSLIWASASKPDGDWFCLWELEEDARYWANQIRGLVVQVEWTSAAHNIPWISGGAAAAHPIKGQRAEMIHVNHVRVVKVVS